jgi:hypothetical protein
MASPAFVHRSYTKAPYNVIGYTHCLGLMSDDAKLCEEFSRKRFERMSSCSYRVSNLVVEFK